MQPKSFLQRFLKFGLLSTLMVTNMLAIQAQNKDIGQQAPELIRLANRNIKVHRPDSSHKPNLAFIKSGIIPGWGQVYNGNWWKVPLIYGSMGLLGSAVAFNQHNYQQYLAVYKLRANPYVPRPAKGTAVRTLYDNTLVQTPTAIEGALNGHQRNMQLSIMGIAGMWGLQMIDAFVDAKFIHSYSMDRDLSFNIKPGISTTGPMYANSNMPAVVPVMRLCVVL
ncbi:DUF5683 domain-containing protein [Mucilaginibacter terrae]|uniref:DUF5683 domain-containing protein n=1 Tax=Mucilaginibacter terrae TaxID=1955052 RepID=UPI00362C506B